MAVTLWLVYSPSQQGGGKTNHQNYKPTVLETCLPLLKSYCGAQQLDVHDSIIQVDSVHAHVVSLADQIDMVKMYVMLGGKSVYQ